MNALILLFLVNQFLLKLSICYVTDKKYRLTKQRIRYYTF